MDYGKDFMKYALSSGISGMDLHYFGKKVNHQISPFIQNQNIDALTPYILEERQMNVTQMDVFSRLMKDRILWVAGAVDENMSSIVNAQLLYLDSVDKKKDISLYLNTPGGSVIDGLAIRDVMNNISCDVATINTAMCASMGSVLLSSGTKGKRSALNMSTVMMHHVSSGTRGVIDDQRITLMESEKYNYLLFKILAENCNKTFEDVHDYANRDAWLNSKEALDYGLIDEIVGLESDKGIDKYMDGFDAYYDKYVLNRKK